MTALALGVLVGFVVISGMAGGLFLIFLSKPSPWKKIIGGFLLVAQLGISILLLNRVSWPKEDSLWLGLGLIGTTALLTATLRIFLKDR